MISGDVIEEQGRLGLGVLPAKEPIFNRRLMIQEPGQILIKMVFVEAALETDEL